MYTVSDFGRMAGDSVRMDAYTRAIAATVRPGSVVLDLGAGTGVMSILALRAGAARVHAVEPNPAVWLIPELARTNGLADRIVVHHASSLEMDVPEKVDVVISDMRGPLPFLDDNIFAMRDVTKRWLAPGGVLMPTRDELKVVLVEAEELDARIESTVRSYESLGIEASTVRAVTRQQAYRDSPSSLHAGDVLSTAGSWTTLDYNALDRDTFEGDVTLEVTRGGIARGLTTFFDTEIVPGIGFTTAPGHAIVYSRLYFPLLEPVRVQVGDRLRVTMRSDAAGNRLGWDTTIDRAGVPVAAYRQSTFLGEPASMRMLVRGADRSLPRLGKKGIQLRTILGSMDGTRTVREIAAVVAGNGPGEDLAVVLESVRGIATRYGE